MENAQSTNKIREAIKLGYRTCTDISRRSGEPLETTFNILRFLVADGELVKIRQNSLDYFEFTPKNTKPLQNTDVIKLNILKAIKENYRTLPWIKKRCGLEQGVDISEVLEELQFDQVIRKCSNTELTAFFLSEELPRNFYQNPDGTVHVDFEEGVPAPEERTSDVKSGGHSRALIEVNEELLRAYAAAGLSLEKAAGKLNIGYSTLWKKFQKNPALRKVWDEGRAKVVVARPTKQVKQTKKRIDWSPEMLEELAAKHYTYAAAAKSVGVHATAITFQLNKHPEMMAAWKRGQSAFLETNPQPTFGRKAVLAETTETTEKGQTMETTTRQVTEEPAPQTRPCIICQKEFNWEPYSSFYEICSENCKTTYFILEKSNKLPKEDVILEIPEVETDPRFSETIEHIAKNGHSRDSIAEVKRAVASKAELLPPLEPPKETFQDFGQDSAGVSHRQNVGEIQLKSGGGIFFGFSGNFFAMTRSERELLNRIADLKEGYRGE